MSETGEASPLFVAIIRKFRRAMRFAAFLCTAGWAFPHVCTEDMDLTRIQNGQRVRNS